MSEFDYEKVMKNPVYKFLIAISVLFFLIFDIARVIVIRLLNKRGPFDPDSSHMHPFLLDKGLQYKTASITMAIC